MKKGDRYSNINELSAFGFIANALDTNKGADGDAGAVFPRSDAEDLSRGARFIPYKVTLARRAGKQVEFVTNCKQSSTCWYWKMPDGARIYHSDQNDFKNIRDNHNGKCPECGNTNINGGTIKPETATS
ncbi:MAG: hypothetical protein AAB432_01530 [Patescibacteria group bacterium]